MTSESDLSDRLTVQSLATITIGGVSLAMKYLRNTQSRLIKLVDNLLHSSAMLVSSLFLSALQVSRPTSGSCLLYMVCLSLVSSGPSILVSPFKSDMHSRFSGRYPWVVEDALRKYGDVIRIAPNELCFITPQAFRGNSSILTSQQLTNTHSDIYSPHQKNLELLVKTNFQNRGKPLGGIVWEEDPIRHREVAKRDSPAFSGRLIKAPEPVAHEYVDYFVARMIELGS